jgi:hypothetical protein
VNETRILAALLTIACQAGATPAVPVAKTVVGIYEDMVRLLEEKEKEGKKKSHL